MNEYASELGMLDSNFVNPTGLPDVNHYSTARDLAKLSISMINDFPEHYSLYKEKEFTFDDIRQLNRNSLLWQDDSVDGVVQHAVVITRESTVCAARFDRWCRGHQSATKVFSEIAGRLGRLSAEAKALRDRERARRWTN